VAVAGIARIGEQHLVAGVQQHAEGEQQRGRRARRHDHAARGYLDAVARAVERAIASRSEASPSAEV
jgi:hypothetical protein